MKLSKGNRLVQGQQRESGSALLHGVRNCGLCSEPALESHCLGFKYWLNLLLAVRIGPALGALVYSRELGNATSLDTRQILTASRFSPGPSTLSSSEAQTITGTLVL